ncbi:hypothetical protein [Microscilla marina]|uniref:Uncharacterized protein n=1 Tax=Microscilla marina ATCC 23134 TaxID=313606 RepID=A1ZE50_MICM2|nr:hypothetical protein [Microscilla marina]EAY31358.1 hypothetical protein M23134_04191 [Microscilla marina ATCC 23134]
MLANLILAVFWAVFIIYIGSNIYLNIRAEYKNTPRRRIRRYYQELEQASNYGEAALQVPFQNLLYDYAKEYGLKLHLTRLAPPTDAPPNPLHKITGQWESISLFADLSHEVNQRMMAGYPRQNILFENTHTALLVQNGQKVAYIDMNDWKKLHQLLLKFVQFNPHQKK